MDFDKLKSKVIPDPLTGGEQTIYYNDEGSFCLSMPHQAIPLPIDYVAPITKTTDLGNGKFKWEIIDNRNCVFNVNAIDDRLKELGALEDIDHEIIEPEKPITKK